MGLIEEVLDCISFMKEFNTQIKSVIDNYKNKNYTSGVEETPTKSVEEIIKESMTDTNLPNRVKILNEEIYRQQIDNLNK